MTERFVALLTERRIQALSAWVVIAATNIADLIDPALLRPGGSTRYVVDAYKVADKEYELRQKTTNGPYVACKDFDDGSVSVADTVRYSNTASH